MGKSKWVAPAELTQPFIDEYLLIKSVGRMAYFFGQLADPPKAQFNCLAWVAGKWLKFTSFEQGRKLVPPNLWHHVFSSPKDLQSRYFRTEGYLALAHDYGATSSQDLWDKLIAVATYPLEKYQEYIAAKEEFVEYASTLEDRVRPPYNKGEGNRGHNKPMMMLYRGIPMEDLPRQCKEVLEALYETFKAMDCYIHPESFWIAVAFDKCSYIFDRYAFPKETWKLTRIKLLKGGYICYC
jgi:hypothetical protein